MIFCDFCKKAQFEVETIIVGDITGRVAINGAAVCSECIAVCNEIIAHRVATQAAEPRE